MLNSVRYLLICRGVLALLIGVLAVGWPSVTVDVSALLFAVYALLAVGTDLIAAFRCRRAGSVIGHVLLAVLSAATGLLTLLWPSVTVLVFALIVACWALGIGIVQIVIAVRRGSGSGERAMWALGGLVSVALAITLVVSPGVGVESLAMMFGLFSTAWGIAMLVIAATTTTSETEVDHLVSS